jgi:hypothetical protein
MRIINSDNSGLFKNIGIVSLLAIIIYLTIFQEKRMRAVLDIPEERILVDNSSSRLLALLISEADFSNDFRWYLFSVTQYSNPVRTELIEEGATTIMVGYYKDGQVQMINSIKSYSVNPLWEAIDLRENFPGETYDNLPIIGVEKASSLQSVNCGHFADKTSRCVVVVSLHNIVFRLDMLIERYIDTDTIRDILDPIMMRLKKESSVFKVPPSVSQ